MEPNSWPLDPVSVAALVVRGLVFEYIGLTAMGAYVTLYQRHLLQTTAARHHETIAASPSWRPAH